jgi:DMSO/TMAO reductase YedYZ molybdopterin-dependent catalytic subunit
MIRRRQLFELGASIATSTLVGPARADAELLQHLGAPQDLGTPLEVMDRLITPNPLFFVRSHFGPPALDPARRLRISGLVRQPIELDLAALRRLPEVTATAVLQCAGNGRALQTPRVPGVQWIHGAAGQATWTGVRLKDVLERAGVLPGAAHVRLAGADLPPKPTVPAFLRSIPLARALDPGTLIAYRMNGEPLSLAHGAPFRLIVPGWAGDHWIKWLTDLRVQKEEAEGFYFQTAYRLPIDPVAPGATVPPEAMRPLTTFPVKSIIAQPLDGSRQRVGKQEITGVAFSGEKAIARVEVSLDGGASWRVATLEGEPGAGRWQVFRHAFEDRTPGPKHAVVRATEAGGATQPEKAAWNPGGYLWNGWHAVSWEVVA